MEIGADGMFNHVDRDLGLAELESEIQRRVAETFWTKVGGRPWGPGAWRPRPLLPATKVAASDRPRE